MAHSLVTSSSAATADDNRDEDDLFQGAAPERSNKRVIIHIDIDSFESQLWIKLKRPELENKDVPVVVVNLDGIILAVNDTAKAQGVTRGNGRNHLEEMKQKHPQLITITTGELFGKQDCFKPQKISDDIFQVLLDYQKTLKDCESITIERSSKDEVFIDATTPVALRSAPVGPDSQVLRPPQRSSVNVLTSAKKTLPNAKYIGQPCVIMEGRNSRIHGSTLFYRILEGWPERLAAYRADETGLAHGAVIAFKLIKLIKERTGFDASAGVAHSKFLAKLSCGRNKPQGITIFTDTSIPRLSKELEFKDIPRYGGKRGQDLVNYFSQKGQDVKTFHDIVTLPFGDLVEAFGVVGSKDKASDARALLTKCRGQDDSIVTKRHFADTINASINFRGTHSVKTWNDFKDRVMNLCRDLSNRIQYNIKRWNRSPQSLVVKVTMSEESNVTPPGGAGRREIDGFVDGTSVYYCFIMKCMKKYKFDSSDVEEIKVIASGFKVSFADEVAHVTPTKDDATHSAAEDNGPGSSKSKGEVKAMSIEFNGSRTLKSPQQLCQLTRKFAEEIAQQIDHYIKTQRSCPSELVFNVALFDGAGSKKAQEWTKENVLRACMMELPDKDTISDFILGCIPDNFLEAKLIEKVIVTLKGIQKFGSEVLVDGKYLRTTKDPIRCPYVFSSSEEED